VARQKMGVRGIIVRSIEMMPKRASRIKRVGERHGTGTRNGQFEERGDNSSVRAG
jgi:hypothetical protein